MIFYANDLSTLTRCKARKFQNMMRKVCMNKILALEIWAIMWKSRKFLDSSLPFAYDLFGCISTPSVGGNWIIRVRCSINMIINPVRHMSAWCVHLFNWFDLRLTPSSVSLLLRSEFYDPWWSYHRNVQRNNVVFAQFKYPLQRHLPITPMIFHSDRLWMSHKVGSICKSW